MGQCKKALSLLLAFAMMLSLVPYQMNANADEAAETVTVKWTDDTGKTVLAEDAAVAKGTAPVYPNETLPTKAADVNGIFVFQGWETDDGSNKVYYNTFPKAERDTVYKAVFKWFEREYRVSFVNYNGEEIATETAAYGTKLSDLFPSTPTAPGVPENAKYSYTFDNWYNGSKYNADSGVTTDLTFRAAYTPVLKEYTVSYTLDNGATTETLGTAFHYGDTPTLPTPSVDGKTFIGWSPAEGPVTGDTTYTALFRSNTSGEDSTHSVYFVTDKGYTKYTVGDKKTAATIAAALDTTKASDPWNTYTFAGWSPAVDTAITADTVFVARYTAEARDYQVVWTNGENALAAASGTSETCSYDTYLENVNAMAQTGELADSLTYTGAEPTWEKPDQLCVFTGWMETLSMPKNTVTLAAQNVKTARKYPVIFTDDDGSVLNKTNSVQYVAYGQNPEAHENPTKAHGNQSYYVFDEWKLSTVNGTRVYTANYTATDIPYTVKCSYVDASGNKQEKQIGTTTYTWSELSDFNIQDKLADNGIVVPETYYKGGATYKFVKWVKTSDVETNTDGTVGSAVVTFTTQYAPKSDNFTVTWLNYDGTELRTDSKLNIGDKVPTPTETPVKPADAANTYTFKEWSGSDDTVLYAGDTYTVTGADVTYTAQFTPTTRTYTVRWLDADGTTIRTDEVAYGNEIKKPSDPAKQSDKAYTYKFSGWDPAFTVGMKVTEDKEYNFTATYTETPRLYKIHFVYQAYDEAGKEISGQLLPDMADMHYLDPIDYDKSIENEKGYPTLKETDAYTFEPLGWVRRPDYVEPLENADGTISDTITFVAQFNATTKTYPVTWKNPGAEEPLSTRPMPFGATPEYLGDTDDLGYDDPTTGTHYVFEAWVPETSGVTTVTSDPDKNVFVAQYEPAYKITWDYPDPTTKDETETPTMVPADEPVRKPDDVPDYPTWVNEDDPSDVYDPTSTTPPTEDKTYVPMFTITWDPDNGETPTSAQVKYLDTPEEPATKPVKNGKTAKGWTPDIVPAVADATYTATYPTSSGSSGGGGGGSSTTTSTVPITWVVDGKKTVSNVPKGDTPVYPNGTPTKDGMVFDGWTPDIVPATKAATYTAVFRDPTQLPSNPVSPTENGIANWLECGEHIIYYRGYPDGTIKPNGNITRNETAMILYRLLKNKNVSITASFTDVPDNEWYTDAVLTLASLGIITGYEDGSFKPLNPITRAEFTAMCVRFVEAADATYVFADILPGFWAYSEIMTAAYNGWITGYPDGTFRPNALIERCEAAAIVNRMLGRVADRSYIDAHEDQLIHFPDLLKKWYYNDMIEGTNAHSYDVIDGKETWTSMYDK